MYCLTVGYESFFKGHCIRNVLFDRTEWDVKFFKYRFIENINERAYVTDSVAYVVAPQS